MTIPRWNTAIVCAAFLFALSGLVARAQGDEAAVQFPVAELGNCGSKAECKTYCDDSANMEACIVFAEKNNLMPQEEIRMAKKFIAAGAKGPGGCTSKDSCEAYCHDPSNMDACIAFAEEAGMMSPDELAEAKKVQAAVRRGVKPPPCGGKQACDAYCSSPENMPACLAFAKEAGLMSEEEMANADKMLTAIKNGAKPPACQGKEECDAYCGQEENFSECVEFGRAAGFMTEQEYEMAKKTGGKGPGGCRGRECESFCQNPENQETCMNFAKEHGLISEDDMQRMEEGGGRRMEEGLSNIPEELRACVKSALGEDAEKIMSGAMRPSREFGEAMSACAQQVRGREGMPDGNPEQRFGPEDRREGYEGGMPPEGIRTMPPEGYRNAMPPEGYRREMPPEFQRQMPPQGMYEGGQPPEGMVRPPEGYRPPEGVMEGQRLPEGAMMPPPPTTESGASGGGEVRVTPAQEAPTVEQAPAPTTEAVSAPAPEPAPAPAAEPAPAPADSGSTSLLSPNSLMAAAINFFRPLFLR